MVKIIIFVFGIGFISFTVLFFVERVRIKKEYDEKMSLEVDKALSNYYLNSMGTEDK